MVDQLCRKLGVSKRKACKALGQARSTQRYEYKQPQKDRLIIKDMLKFSEKYRRYGYRRITVELSIRRLRVRVPSASLLKFRASNHLRLLALFIEPSKMLSAPICSIFLLTAAIWAMAVCFYGLLIPLLALKIAVISLLLFLLIYLIQNIWRPLLVSRLNACSRPGQAATTLSIESQTKSTAAMIIAPVLGLAVVHLGIWSVGALGCLISLLFWTKRKNI